MRLWEEKAPLSKFCCRCIGSQSLIQTIGGHESERDYEVVGYVLEGKAELHIEGQMILLEKGSVASSSAHSDLTQCR